MRTLGYLRKFLMIVCFALAAAPAWTQHPPVTAQVQIEKAPGAKVPSKPDASNVVVWLVPLDANDRPISVDPPPGPQPKLVQRNKMFEPHLLVVQAGTMVQFPNEDPFFHNVFSLFDGKRFDLGLYEAGSSRSVRFDRPGVSFLFCNIHEDMSAVVVAVETPYFGASDAAGNVTIRNVPDGRYRLRVWYERSRAEDLGGLDRVVSISSASRALETIHVRENPDFTLEHKNKYGQEYVPPANSTY